MNPELYERSPAWKQGGGWSEQVQDFFAKNSMILMAVIVVLAVLVIYSVVGPSAKEQFGALMPGGLMDMQSQQVNGWGENFTTKRVENFSLPKNIFSINEQATAAPQGKGTSYFAKEVQQNGQLDMGSSAYKVLSDKSFDCSNRNAGNADSWQWMNQMAQQETSERLSDRNVDKNLYLAAQGH